MCFLRYRYFGGFRVPVPELQIASQAAKFEVEQKGPRTAGHFLGETQTNR